ncbi:MAG: phage holin family protein [Candidatus Paceibacterota bacterium]
MGIIIGLFSNILALYLANIWVEGFAIVGGIKGYLIAGLVLGILSLIVKPVLKIISFPLIFISLGLFIIVINAIVLWLTGQLTNFIIIESNVALLWATVIVSLVNFITRWFK